MKRGLLLSTAALLLLGASEAPQRPPTLSPAEAALQGRALAAALAAQVPDRNATNSAVMEIRDAQGSRTDIPMTIEVAAAGSNWLSIYSTHLPASGAPRVRLEITHTGDQPNRYQVTTFENTTVPRTESIPNTATMIPFAGSDFWVADLGLEFFHWPDQHLVRKEIRRGQSCDVLESVNPHPAPGAYLRVVSWIDRDSGGIIYAQAFDSRDKLLKEFLPRSVKKVRGEWEPHEMEMENRQTDSETRIELNFDQK